MSNAYALYKLLDLHSMPKLPVYNIESISDRIDLLAAIEQGYREGLLDLDQIHLLDAFISGFSMTYLETHGYKNVNDELSATLNVIAELSDYKDEVFKYAYCSQYKIGDEELSATLERIGSDYTIVQEI